jgi:acyl-CoA synthetase (AMP-forming)/AMP-acid ligase II
MESINHPPDALVHHFLERCAQVFPDRPAAYHKGVWHTFAELDRQANAMARHLLDLGLARGDRVAMLLMNSREYIVTYYGILKAGGIAVPLNTDLIAESLPWILQWSGSRFLVTADQFRTKLPALAEQLGAMAGLVYFGTPGDLPSDFLRSLSCPVRDGDGILADERPENPGIRVIDDDVASIVFTSGSTGRPRGVTLKHCNIRANTRSIVTYLELSPADRIMVVLPFYYIYGKSLLNTHFYVGGSVVIDNRFAYPNAVLKTMAETGCTGFSGVPSTFAILTHRSAVRDFSFPALRYVTQAGGAMAPELQKEVDRVFHPARLFIMYGATEASARLSYLDPADLPRKWGSIGRAIPNVELYVADEDGRELPQGEVGELVARGSNIMVGYWNDPEATAEVLRNGLYFTSDLGRMDEEGFLFVVGRKKEMIKRGAHRISAKEIEEKVLECEGVMEVAVFGIPDEILGEAIVCCVSADGTGTLDEAGLLEYCKIRLDPFKIPSYVRILPELPKKASHKIDKSRLREDFLASSPVSN